jgi:pimeloyl-ACP methyl ester carboxylesterase
MLALAHAAEHPASAAALVLVGCGTFDLPSRARMREILDARMDAGLRAELERLSEEIADPDERLRRTGDLLQSVYIVDPVDPAADDEVYDETAHRETWRDMLRQQESGVYPAAFAAIGSPVLMLHGAEDPHPGAMIRESLRRFLPQLEYREWARCGHYPWLERGVRDDFIRTMEAWLRTRVPGSPDGASGEPAR